MDRVILKDFEVVACHGANPEEKINPQRFLISATIFLDVEESAQLDDLSKTVSYSAVKKEIKCFFEQNCFDLLETLAVRCCHVLLKKFDLINAVEIEVKKPDAPMSGKFDYVSVALKRAWHKVYLALGSNLGDSNGYFDIAISRLCADDNIKNVKESSRIVTEPFGGVAKFDFLNSAVECLTLYSPKQLLRVVNGIEKECGRERKEHWGDRTLDIDILFYDDEVVQENDLCIPHIDLQNRDFVLRPLYELCPYKVHPLLGKRVEDMLRDLPQLL